MGTSGETAITGAAGKFSVGGTLVARVTKWDVDAKLAHVNEWGDSDGEGYTNRLAGRWDCLFTSEGKFDVEDEFYNLFDEGDILHCLLKINANFYWTFPRALCISYKLAVDVDREEVVGWTSSWGSDGPFYKPGETGY